MPDHVAPPVDPSFTPTTTTVRARGDRLWIWTVVVLACAALVLNIADRQILSILKPVIASDLHWTDDDYATLAALFQTSSALAYLAAGRIVDRLGFRRAAPLGVLAWSIITVMHAAARNLTQFAMCRVLLGATESLGSPAATKAIASVLPTRQRGTGYGLFNGLGSLGALAAPILITAGAVAWGWRMLFCVAGASGVLWTSAWVLTMRYLPHAATPLPAQERSKPGYRILHDRQSWGIIIGKAFSDSPWWFMSFWLPDLLHRQFGLKGIALGETLSLCFGAGAIGALLGGWASGRLIAKGVAPITARLRCLFVLSVVFALTPLSLWSGLAATVMIFSVLVAAHQAFSSNMFALIADSSPPEHLGRTISLGSLSGIVGSILLLKSTGWFLSSGAGYAPVLYFVACSYAVAATGAYYFLRPTHLPEPEDGS